MSIEVIRILALIYYKECNSQISSGNTNIIKSQLTKTTNESTNVNNLKPKVTPTKTVTTTLAI